MAGTNSIAITLSWALSLLLNKMNTLRKAHEELDIHVGRGRLMKETDVKNLVVYIQAIIKETRRLHPAAPLAPHQSMEDCEIGGYHVPAGTRLLNNLPKLQRDPDVWTDPCEFRPERFLPTHKIVVDVRGQHFELLPFGWWQKCVRPQEFLSLFGLCYANYTRYFTSRLWHFNAIGVNQ